MPLCFGVGWSLGRLFERSCRRLIRGACSESHAPRIERTGSGPGSAGINIGAGATALLRRAFVAVLPALLMSALPLAAMASQAAAPASNGNEATGFQRLVDTGAYLKSRGVVFGGFLQLDASHLLSGGLPDPVWLDKQYLLDLNVTVDTGRLLGLPGGTLFVDAQGHAGPNVIATQVPAIADPDNMDADRTNTIDRAWYQQNWLAQKLQLQVGLMYVDDKFLTVPYGGNFVSLDFSSDASISTFVLPTYPKGAWGANLWAYPNTHLSFSLGVFRDNSTELPYNPGGNLLITEEAWQDTWHGLPWGIQLGAWTDTGTFQRFQGGLARRASGMYLVASDKLWQSAGSTDRGIGMFLQLGSAPSSVAPVRRHIGIGLVWTGPSAARPHDEFGIAVSHSILTGENDFTQAFERETEIYYQFDVSHGWTIQSDLEFWQHAGGGDTPDTLLGLVRIMYTF